MLPSPRSPFAREPAFTLIEVLVVLAVLASLAGIGFGAAQGIRALADLRQTRAELARVAAALESARVHWGRYPTTPDPASWYATLAGRSDPEGQPLAEPGRRFLEPAGLRLAVEPEADPANALSDPWGRAYVYVPPTSDSTAHGAAFLLFSAGPDGEPGRHHAGEPDATDPATRDNLYAPR
jgi:prepilin-type N-terminal cleavage/methylation domain-containing protein